MLSKPWKYAVEYVSNNQLFGLLMVLYSPSPPGKEGPQRIVPDQTELAAFERTREDAIWRIERRSSPEDVHEAQQGVSGRQRGLRVAGANQRSRGLDSGCVNYPGACQLSLHTNKLGRERSQ